MSILLLVLSLGFVTFAQAAETIQVGDEVLVHKFEEANDFAKIDEFIPKGQTLQNWKTLVAIREFYRVPSPEAYIEALKTDYQNGYPHMKFETGSDPQRGVFWIDYLLYSEKGDPIPNGEFIEWNFFAVRKAKGKGVVLFQYAKREYDPESPFKAAEKLKIRELRARMLPILKKHSF